MEISELNTVVLYFWYQHREVVTNILATKGSRILEKKVNETKVSKTVFSHLKYLSYYSDDYRTESIRALVYVPAPFYFFHFDGDQTYHFVHI